MISHLFPPIRALILDMDGVLWRQNDPLIDLRRAFAYIDSIGLQVILATNNATKNVSEYQEKFAGFGVTIREEQIVNSAMAMIEILSKVYPAGGNVYIIGTDSLVDYLETNGFHQAEKDVLAVVVGMDPHFNFEKLDRATRLIRNGTPFYGTNPDASFPTPTGLGPGAGAILAAIATGSSVQPIIAGKPEPYMMQLAMRRMNVNADDTLAVGDRLETDILGGQKAGCRTALVLSGVTRMADLEQSSIHPDIVANHLDQLLGIH